MPFSAVSPVVEGEFSSYLKSCIPHACPRDFVSFLDIGQDLRALSSKNKLPFLQHRDPRRKEIPKTIFKKRTFWTRTLNAVSIVKICRRGREFDFQKTVTFRPYAAFHTMDYPETSHRAHMHMRYEYREAA